MKILLVYEMVPEYTSFYVFDEPTPEQLQLLRDTNGLLVNHNNETKEQNLNCNRLYMVISAAEKPESSESLMNDFGHDSIDKFDNVTKLDPLEAPAQGPFEKVFFSGFIL